MGCCSYIKKQIGKATKSLKNLGKDLSDTFKHATGVVYDAFNKQYVYAINIVHVRLNNESLDDAFRGAKVGFVIRLIKRPYEESMYHLLKTSILAYKANILNAYVTAYRNKEEFPLAVININSGVDVTTETMVDAIDDYYSTTTAEVLTVVKERPTVYEYLSYKMYSNNLFLIGRVDNDVDYPKGGFYLHNSDYIPNLNLDDFCNNSSLCADRSGCPEVCPDGCVSDCTDSDDPDCTECPDGCVNQEDMPTCRDLLEDWEIIKYTTEYLFCKVTDIETIITYDPADNVTITSIILKVSYTHDATEVENQILTLNVQADDFLETKLIVRFKDAVKPSHASVSSNEFEDYLEDFIWLYEVGSGGYEWIDAKYNLYTSKDAFLLPYLPIIDAHTATIITYPDEEDPHRVAIDNTLNALGMGLSDIYDALKENSSYSNIHGAYIACAVPVPGEMLTIDLLLETFSNKSKSTLSQITFNTIARYHANDVYDPTDPNPKSVTYTVSVNQPTTEYNTIISWNSIGLRQNFPYFVNIDKTSPAGIEFMTNASNIGKTITGSGGISYFMGTSLITMKYIGFMDNGDGTINLHFDLYICSNFTQTWGLSAYNKVFTKSSGNFGAYLTNEAIPQMHLPINLLDINDMTPLEVASVYPALMHMVIFAADRSKIAWYQTGVFKAIIQAVTVVIAVIIAVISVGSLTAVAIALVVSVGIALIIPQLDLLMKKLGLPSWMRITILIILSLAVMYFSGNFDSLGTVLAGEASTATTILSAGASILSAVAVAGNMYVMVESSNLLESQKEFDKKREKRENEIAAAQEDLDMGILDSFLDAFNSYDDLEYLENSPKLDKPISVDKFMYIAKGHIQYDYSGLVSSNISVENVIKEQLQVGMV